MNIPPLITILFDNKLCFPSVPALPDALLICCECGRKFAESYLFTKFQLSTCDKCRWVCLSVYVCTSIDWDTFVNPSVLFISLHVRQEIVCKGYASGYALK